MDDTSGFSKRESSRSSEENSKEFYLPDRIVCELCHNFEPRSVQSQFDICETCHKYTARWLDCEQCGTLTFYRRLNEDYICEKCCQKSVD